MATGDLYSADQIVGKTLYGKTEVPIKRLPMDAAPVVYTGDAGKAVGVVYSWLDAKPGRSNLYWMFYDSMGKPYYAEHIEGRFSTSELAEQGTLTVKEQVEAQQKKDESTKDFIERMVKYAVIGLGAFMVIKAVIPNLFLKKK
jgi:hypothetical protein